MNPGVKLKLDKKTISNIDNRRGDLTRDEYIAKVLSEHLIDKKRVSFSKEEIIGDNNSLENSNNILTSQSFEVLINNFQDLATDIYNKLEKLDRKINQLQIDYDQDLKIKNETKINLDQQSYDDTGHRENKKVFQFSAEDEEVEFIPAEEDDDNPESDEVVFYVDESGEYLGDDYTEVEEYDPKSPEFDGEIEYGCPFCNATISEDATYCDNCGNNFDESYSDQRTPSDFAVVEPLNNNFNKNGRYDPRPEYIKRRDSREKPPMNKIGTKRNNGGGFQGNVVEIKVPHCSNCGNDLAYVENYKRWYCYDCKKYYGGIPPPKNYNTKPRHYPTPTPTPKPQATPTIASPKPASFISEHEPQNGVQVTTQQQQTRPINRQNEVKKKKQRDANWQPLKDYHRYSD